MTEKMYCLEILRKIENHEEMRARGGMFEHVGYEHRVDPSTGCSEIMLFRTKSRAAEYYDRNKRDIGHGYPDDYKMRLLNAHNTWRSDWHPVTKLAYVVREDHGVVASPTASGSTFVNSGVSECTSRAIEMTD